MTKYYLVKFLRNNEREAEIVIAENPMFAVGQISDPYGGRIKILDVKLIEEIKDELV